MLTASRSCVVSTSSTALYAASSAVKQPLGMRSPVVGFAAEVANTLLQSCDASSTDGYCSELAELLNGCEDWQGSIEPQGAIHALLQEQDGQLCGTWMQAFSDLSGSNLHSAFGALTSCMLMLYG